MSVTVLLESKMNDGLITIKEEESEKKTLLSFLVDFRVKLRPDQMFNQFVLAMTDTNKAWIWPSEYEYSPGPPIGGLKKGCLYRMTYTVPRFDKPHIIPKPVTYTYTLDEFSPEYNFFIYRSIDHPLKGGATVELHPIGDSGCQIKWEGAYEQDNKQQIVIDSMVKYIPLFFGAMERRIMSGPPK